MASRLTQSPIVLISFNRPNYLGLIIDSLLKQENAGIQDREVILFQDGGRSPHSGVVFAAQGQIDSCIATFKEKVPFGRVYASDHNLGVAMNFDRAETHVFEQLRADAAIFLEDDLLLSKHYLSTLDTLIAENLDHERVGYLSAYGDHKLPAELQRINKGALMTLHHNWGFAVYRRQWERMRPHVLQYLDFVNGRDYSKRDHAGIKKLFAGWGYNPPATSQDAAKTVVCCLLRTVKLNTVACFAKYIGERGLHMNPDEFRRRNYDATEMLEESVEAFEPVTDVLYENVLGEMSRWAGVEEAYEKMAPQVARAKQALEGIRNREALRQGGRTDVTASFFSSGLYRFSGGTNVLRVIERLFHFSARYARENDEQRATSAASQALVLLFEGTATLRQVSINFYAISEIRNVDNESHVRIDLRGQTVRIVCPKQILRPNFTNYFEAFLLIAALLEVLTAEAPPNGAFTVDLGGGGNVGNYPRISFSSALKHAHLILDPEFFHSGGHKALRESFKADWVLWQDRQDAVFWRGNTTGAQTKPTPAQTGTPADWSWLQRLQIVALARVSAYADRLNVGITQIVQINAPEVKAHIEAADMLRGTAQNRDLISHRYVLVADENSSAANGMLQALLSGACVLSVASRGGFRSWFYDRLVPWESYVPVSADLLDFEERLDWIFNNPARCAQIAERGRAIAASMSLADECKISVDRILEVMKLNL